MELIVDTQAEPTGTIAEAQKAILALMDSEEPVSEETPEVEEAEPSEAEIAFEAEEESEEVLEDDSTGEIADDEEAEFLFEIDGQELTADEIRKGYLRQSDYTKKTQSLAEQRKEIDALTERYNAQLNQIQNERQQYIQHLQALSQNQDPEKKFDIDWERLRLEDPLEYVTKRQEFQEAKDRANELKERAKQARAKAAADQQEQWAKVVEHEKAQLIAALPEWGETESQRQLATDLRSYAQSVGYSEPEIDSLVDHRSFLVLRKAMLYDQLQGANPKAKKLKGKPKVIRAGKGNSPTQQQRDAQKTKRNQLKNTGHIRDAAKVFEDFI
jgi:hypothetical protein